MGVLKIIGISGTIRDVAVLLSAMPAGTITAILAEKYDCDSTFASQAVLVSTVLSVCTLPIISAILTVV